MINNVLKNFCLITFALIAPITLPAGGIQKRLERSARLLGLVKMVKQIILLTQWIY